MGGRHRHRTMRVGFLFNHDQIHQVAHSLPIALALARSGVDAEIVVATTNARLTQEVRRLGGGLIGHRIQMVELGVGCVALYPVRQIFVQMLLLRAPLKLRGGPIDQGIAVERSAGLGALEAVTYIATALSISRLA